MQVAWFFLALAAGIASAINVAASKHLVGIALHPAAIGGSCTLGVDC